MLLGKPLIDPTWVNRISEKGHFRSRLSLLGWFLLDRHMSLASFASNLPSNDKEEEEELEWSGRPSVSSYRRPRQSHSICLTALAGAKPSLA